MSDGTPKNISIEDRRSSYSLSSHNCRTTFYGEKLDKTNKTRDQIVRAADHDHKVQKNNIMKAIDQKTEMIEKAYQVVIYCIIL